MCANIDERRCARDDGSSKESEIIVCDKKSSQRCIVTHKDVLKRVARLHIHYAVILVAVCAGMYDGGGGGDGGGNDGGNGGGRDNDPVRRYGALQGRGIH